MRFAYFDTNIFDHISSEEINKLGGLIQDVNELKSLLKNNNIQVVSSPQVLGELSITSESNPKKAMELCFIFKQLCEDRIIKQWVLLITEEWHIYYNKSLSKINIFLNRSHPIYNVLNELISGDFSNPEGQKFIKGEIIRKKSSHVSSKKQVREMSESSKKAIREFSSFESFYSALKQANLWHKRIKEILAAHKIGSKNGIDKNASIIASNLDDFPHWNSAMRSEAITTWDYIKNSADIRRGDTFDMTDALNLTFLSRDDFFVSDDGNHRRRCALLKPHLRIFDLREFIGLLK